MKDLIDIRTPLATSKNACVELALALVGNEDGDEPEANAEVCVLPARLR
jgi:hypothetical protein